MSLLALDIATKSGYCLMNPDNREILQAGVIDAKIRVKATKTIDADHIGRRLNIFNDEISKIFRYANQIGHPVQTVAYERITTGRAAGGRTSAVARHLEAMVIRASYLHDTMLHDVATNTLKKWATGDGSSKRSETNDKAAMMAVAKKKYPKTHEFLESIGSWDDNVADAILVADWAVNADL